MDTFRSVLRRRSIGRAVLLAWLLSALAFAGDWWLLWPFITTGVLDARPEVGGALLLPAFAWFWLGGALRDRSPGARPTRAFLSVPWLLLLALSESALAGMMALLALGPLILQMSRNWQLHWVADLGIAQYIMLGLIYFAAFVWHATRRNDSRILPRR